MKKIIAALTLLFATACTQPASPPAAPSAETDSTAKAQETPNTVPTTPILSLLVGSGMNPAVKGKWCLKDGAAPFTKISAQDESIAAPIENRSAPVPSTSKDTATQQAPGTAHTTAQTSDSQFHIQWLSAGIKGEADLMLQGDTLSFTDENGKATFSRCP